MRRGSALCYAAVLIVSIMGTWIAAPGRVSAREVPMEPSAFTNHVAQRFKQALPGYEIAIKGPLTLIVKGVSGQEMMQANLDTVYSFCQRNAPRCEDAIERQSSAIIDTVKHSGTAPQRSQLRAVLRPSAYIEQLRKQGGAPVAVPFMGDLWVASVVDFPTQVRFLNTKDLSSLSLSSAEAIDLAKRNVVAALPPLASVTRDLPARGIGTINGDAYEASRLLFVDMWAPLAKRFGGKLIVSAPATDFVLYSSENDPITIDALGALARKIATRAQRPVSFAVLQWSPTGWMQVSP